MSYPIPFLKTAKAWIIALALVSTVCAVEYAVEREPSGDIAILIDGELFTRYVTSDEETNKCYFWPVIGPGGAKMTRAFPMEDVPGEKQDHPHHRSICFGMQEAGGFNTWHEKLTFTKNGVVDENKLKTTGRQVHTKVVRAKATKNAARLVVHCDNTTPDGEVYLREIRSFVFRQARNGSRIIDVEIQLVGVKDSITIVGKKDSGLSVRVAHSMSVDAGEGGTIVNSAGDRDKGAWGKRAPWVDFNGPVEGKRMGVAMLNHPDSFRYPTPWHARTYGLFTANPFALKEVAGEEESGDFDLKKGERVLLKHRLIFHEGDEKAAKIANAWKNYSE